MTDAEANASSNFRFSRNESKKSKTKNKSLKKIFFSWEKKPKASLSIEREHRAR